MLKNIKALVNSGKYRIRIHAVRHMIEEGFCESDIIEAVTGNSKILENYINDCRCLIVGYFYFSGTKRMHLHVVCEYSRNDLIDIVTAYMPKKPWWASPTKRGNL